MNVGSYQHRYRLCVIRPLIYNMWYHFHVCYDLIEQNKYFKIDLVFENNQTTKRHCDIYKWFIVLTRGQGRIDKRCHCTISENNTLGYIFKSVISMTHILLLQQLKHTTHGNPHCPNRYHVVLSNGGTKTLNCISVLF